MDVDLARRLVEAGVDPDRIGDPAEAWCRLFDAFGLQATLIDRYALEAEARGLVAAALPQPDRRRLAHEVLAVRYPGLEVIGPSRGDPVVVVPYDVYWPAAFERWRGRIAATLGEAALRIEHVGSTAVPGLAAKPVVDVQVSVADAEEEAAYLAGIESLGVPLRSREPGHRYFRPSSGREVQVHVCDAGGDRERTHLLFRDYLLAHPAVCRDYAALKLALAERYRDDRLAYNEAKTGFILDALEAAERWAKAAGWPR